MNREEFTERTKVAVSGRYYGEMIEPSYMNGVYADKDDFCANWLKQHSRYLVKAVESDIARMSLDICTMDANKAEAARAESELETVRKELSETKRDFEKMQKELREEKNCLQASHDLLAKSCEEYKETIGELREVQTKNSELENEILKLKAMLFDLTIGKDG